MSFKKLIYILFLIPLFVLLFSCSNNNDSNYIYLKVQTTSMMASSEFYSKEPYNSYEIKGIEKGSQVKVEKITDDLFLEYEIGDVITYYLENSDSLNSKRIVDFLDDKVIVECDKFAETNPYILITDDMSDDEINEAAITNYNLETSGYVDYVTKDRILGKVVEVIK